MQPCWNHCRGHSLAAPDKKVAPAKINRIIRLRWLTQRNAPGHSGVEPKSNSRAATGQA
jgi:hypothetical protein